MSLTFVEIVQGIANTFSDLKLIKEVQALGTLKENVDSTPCIQVYPEEGSLNANLPTDRTSFRGVIRRHTMTVLMDCYVKRRGAAYGQEALLQAQVLDEIYERFEAQKTKSYFGVNGIQSFQMGWERTNFVWGDQLTPYTGLRFTISLEIG